MSTTTKHEIDFHVEKLDESGRWVFWFNGRGKSARDLRRRIAWKTRGEGRQFRIIDDDGTTTEGHSL